MSRKLEDRIVDRLDEAISEAERFLARAKLARNAMRRGKGGAAMIDLRVVESGLVPVAGSAAVGGRAGARWDALTDNASL
jgi:hypothetical protein